jgi:ElaB/YqjD/DUF883 family membrane-anchored ribosome-binding protein
MATITESSQFPTSETPRPDLATGRAAPGSAQVSTGSGPSPGDDLMSRAVQGAHQTIDRLAGQAAPHVQRLEEKLTGADDRLHEGADQLRQVSEGYVRSLRESVRENPLAAVGVALVLGLLVARITR